MSERIDSDAVFHRAMEDNHLEDADIREGLVANFRDGQNDAFDHRLTSDIDLRAAIEHNAAFAHRYDHDVAFKLGGDSMVWPNANGQPPSAVNGGPRPNSLEVRG